MKFFIPDTSYTSSKKSRRAFTLVEMIVALGIFSIVAVVALGALVKIISANKKAQTLQASITNLNFALDAMSRELRVGTNYSCYSNNAFSTYTLSTPTVCPISSGLNSGSAIIAFNSSKASNIGSLAPCNLIYAYLLKYDSASGTYDLQKAQQSTCDAAPYTFDSIIDPNVTITSYYLKVNYDPTNYPYPRAVLRLSGYAGIREKEKTYFDVQTTVSARLQ